MDNDKKEPRGDFAEDLALLKKNKDQSEKDRQSYEARWAKNLRLVKGIWGEDEKTRSQVRGRSKIFFRKGWSNNVRLLASFYNAFLRELDNFKIEGRGPEDSFKAKVLQFMTEYRRDYMMRRQGFFMKMIHGFLDILECGVAPAIMYWNYDGETDEPCFDSFPPEQVYPDFAASTKDKMRYIYFESYLSKEEMEEMGLSNIENGTPVKAPYNQVRAARNYNTRDPLQNPGENEYPTPGRYNNGEVKGGETGKYRVFQCFYRQGKEIRYCVTNGDMSAYHKKPRKSPYGDRIPAVLGICLPVAHKLFGEGFPEVWEGPQESYNDTLNRRKDNVALAMNKHTFVSRFGNVDLQSLINSRAGAYTLMDDVTAVKERDINDVTQSAYLEAQVDDAMMQELSAVTDIKNGMSRNEKATTASINLQESNAKIDLFIAIVAETYVREIFSLLAFMIQRFETDETIYRVANERFREKTGINLSYDIYEIDDFEADCIVNVGAGTVGREVEIRNGLMVMDRMIMSNQAAIALLSSGAVPPSGLKMFDMTAVVEDLLPKFGKRDVQRYIMNVPPPPPESGGTGDPGAQGPRGSMQPQVGDLLSPANDLQRGGAGGI